MWYDHQSSVVSCTGLIFSYNLHVGGKITGCGHGGQDAQIDGLDEGNSLVKHEIVPLAQRPASEAATGRQEALMQGFHRNQP